MSLSKLILPRVTWGEFLEILSFLTTNEIRRSINAVNRSGYLTYLFMLNSRRCDPSHLGNARFLKRCDWFIPLRRQTRPNNNPSISPPPPIHPRPIDKVLLVSYPRSGNSFLRLLLESNTGIITGSDSRSNRPLSARLLQCGFRGEGITDNSVWVVKSHYPERLGYIKFLAGRTVLLVRNPFDALESYFHMGLTNSHDKALHPTTMSNPAIASLWDEFITNEAKVWATFHTYWIAQAAEGRTPVLFVRFEDLVSHQGEVMSVIEKYMTERDPCTCWFDTVCGSSFSVDSISGSNSATPVRPGPGYQPKEGTRKVGKSLQAMTCIQQQYVLNIAGSVMRVLGYRVSGAGEGAVLHVEELSMGIGHRAHAGTHLSKSSEISPPSTLSSTTSASITHSMRGVVVNESASIRCEGDRFGRGMMDIRRRLTADDTVPLLTR